MTAQGSHTAGPGQIIAAGALAAARTGAQPSLPTRDEREAFLGLEA